MGTGDGPAGPHRRPPLVDGAGREGRHRRRHERRRPLLLLGAGMRFLVRFRNVARMQGVDATATVIERGRQRCDAEGLSDRIGFTLADVCDTGLAAPPRISFGARMPGATWSTRGGWWRKRFAC